MPRALVWTSDTDSRLLEMREAGLPWHQVASTLQVGRNAAIERSRLLGLRPFTRIQPPPAPVVERVGRPALPAGHPVSWSAITAGTIFAGEPYPCPVFL